MHWYVQEMNDLRTQLGQEMVASHENKSKYTSVTEQLQELKTKFAVSEEMFKVCLYLCVCLFLCIVCAYKFAVSEELFMLSLSLCVYCADVYIQVCCVCGDVGEACLYIKGADTAAGS